VTRNPGSAISRPHVKRFR